MVLEGVFNGGQDRGVVFVGFVLKGTLKASTQREEEESDIGSEYNVVK